jgi:hypothetical protein
MKRLEDINTIEEMVQALEENRIDYNCRITGFEIHKEGYWPKNYICIAWWNYRGGQSPVDDFISYKDEVEKEEMYNKWWLALELAGGKTKTAYEKEQKAIAERNRKFKKEMAELRKEIGDEDWIKALGI